jgi:Tol biopolymer transport system component/DNA-binding winged helix-turn-helix (wHTH) protein
MNAQEPTPRRIVRFGLFELDTKSKELHRNGMRVKLSTQPFQVLVLLLEHAGDVVTREELRVRLWPEDTFVDFDHGLNAAVKRLRDALGETAESPVFIETLPRLGYRFIGSIENSPAGQPTVARVTKWNKKNWSLVAVGAVVCIVFVITLSRLSTKLPLGQMTVLPLVTYSGQKYFPSLSPNGQQLVFSWNGGSGTDFSLYEKVVGSEKFLRLTNVAGAIDFAAAWSPDAREIAFARTAKGDTGIYIVSALGGPERKLLHTDWDARSPGIGALASGCLDWSPDGKSIVYSDSPSAGQPEALFVLSLDSMQTRQLTSPNYQTGDLDPKFSPDGQTIAFIRDTTGGQSIYVTPISGNGERLLTADPSLKVGLAWTVDGRNLVFGGRWLWRVPITGGTPERLPIGQNGCQPSVRQNRIAYTQASWSDSIWRRRLDSKGTPEEAQKLISSTQVDAGPQFSPDGNTIAFQSDRSGVFEIWLSNRDGTDVRQLTHFGVAWTGTPRWSPDGKFVVFDSRPKGDADIFTIDAQGGPPQRITNDPSNEVVPSWSRDGHWIYFASDRSGRWEVWKAPSSGGIAIQITHRGGFAAFESADGKLLYYAKGLNAPGLWKTSPSGGEESEVVGMPGIGFWGYWALVKDGIYYLDNTSEPSISFLNLSTRRTSRVFKLENGPVQQAPGLAVSPDGNSILYTQGSQSNSDISLVQNFN